jgi:hypothetical protein
VSNKGEGMRDCYVVKNEIKVKSALFGNVDFKKQFFYET